MDQCWVQSPGHGHSWLPFSWSQLRRSRMDYGQDLYHPKVGAFCMDGLRFCCARGSLFPCGSLSREPKSTNWPPVSLSANASGSMANYLAGPREKQEKAKANESYC